jgi:carboxylesterase type B
MKGLAVLRLSRHLMTLILLYAALAGSSCAQMPAQGSGATGGQAGAGGAQTQTPTATPSNGGQAAQKAPGADKRSNGVVVTPTADTQPDTPKASGPDQALYEAVLRNDLHAVQALVKAKANVNLRRNGLTPVLNVVNREKADANSMEILKLLLDNGADLKAQNNQHETALYLAVKKERPEMLRLLLEHHADPKVAAHQNIQSAQPETPLGYVRSQLHDRPNDATLSEMERLLLAAGAKN